MAPTTGPGAADNGDMGMAAAVLVFTHLLAFLFGLLVGERLEWNAVRREPTGYRTVLAALVLLTLAAAVILVTRGGTS